ncbi:DUF1488 family protein [Paraburkholderia hospita]|uniref:DUF1488 domain-containing protein n=1 Tax=Paraburkholderia hospita TaxID=169430 RepID=A0AAN1JMS8_9BURK|nr:DUF1488 family protein [Paraburkholderia hospita]AUT76665.1 DUF1488 domain-containing protein [Paraburkholderia hospita]OUL80924.1 hypothetical protein CA603_31050 [Paraburkholderia hospita]SEI26034.1 Protein of unknown function [Paraburkholderia hospita]
METVELEPQVLADRRGVVFSLVRPNGAVECVITLATLEAHFWLEPRASDASILKTFRDGYGRIRAIAERRLLAHPAARIELTPADFARP